MKPPRTVNFQGVTYCLMGRGIYYLGKPGGKPKGLHVAVYEFFSGCEVPKGYHVHHKDRNTHNNDFSNLECLPAAEHQKRAKKKPTGFRLKGISLRQDQHLSIIRDQASEWHRSEEGRRWHKEQAESRKRPQFDLTCTGCQTAYKSAHSDGLFCSRKCWRKHHLASGSRNVDVDCVICGNRFTTKQEYEGGRIASTCTRSCRMKLSHQNRKEKTAE